MAISKKANRLKQQLLLLQDRGLAPSTPLPQSNPVQYLANNQPALSTRQYQSVVDDPLGIDRTVNRPPNTTGGTPTNAPILPTEPSTPTNAPILPTEPTPITPSVWEERKAELSKWYSEQQAQYGTQRELEEQRLGSDREVQVKNTDYYFSRLQKYLNDLNAVRGLSNSGLAESSQLQIGLNQANVQRGINAEYQDKMSEIATRYGQWMTDLQKQYQDRGDYYTEREIEDNRYQDSKEWQQKEWDREEEWRSQDIEREDRIRAEELEQRKEQMLKSEQQLNYDSVQVLIESILQNKTDYTDEDGVGFDTDAIEEANEYLDELLENKRITQEDYELLKKKVEIQPVLQRNYAKEITDITGAQNLGNNIYYKDGKYYKSTSKNKGKEIIMDIERLQELLLGKLKENKGTRGDYASVQKALNKKNVKSVTNVFGEWYIVTDKNDNEHHYKMDDNGKLIHQYLSGTQLALFNRLRELYG